MQPTSPTAPPPEEPPAAPATAPPAAPPAQGSGLQSRAPEKPSICRMVVYHSHGHPVPSAFPAVVQKVNADGSLGLFVLGQKGHMIVDNIVEGTGVNNWSWPART